MTFLIYLPLMNKRAFQLLSAEYVLTSTYDNDKLHASMDWEKRELLLLCILCAERSIKDTYSR